MSVTDLPLGGPPDLPPGITLEDVAPDALCSLGQRPYLLTGGLVTALRQHFAERDQVEDPTLKDLIWVADPTSAIVIESSTRWKPEESGQRPAVVVRRGDVQVISLGINDEHMGEFSRDGASIHTVFLAGHHTLFCLDHEAGGAERLGAEVYRELIQFGPVLRHWWRLNRFKVAEVGGLHRVEEAMGSYAVPVTVAYAFEETWRLSPQAPRLKRVGITAIVAEMS